MPDRPSIPAQVKRRVLVEAGHRCAIPTCRHPTTELAHIKPYSEVERHEHSNLIALCPNCHTRYDQGEIDRKSMRIYKRKIAFLSDRFTQFELIVMRALRDRGKIVVQGPLAIASLIADELVANASTISTFDYSDGTKEVTEFVAVLTDCGKRFLDQWEDAEDEALTY